MSGMSNEPTHKMIDVGETTIKSADEQIKELREAFMERALGGRMGKAMAEKILDEHEIVMPQELPNNVLSLTVTEVCRNGMVRVVDDNGNDQLILSPWAKFLGLDEVGKIFEMRSNGCKSTSRIYTGSSDCKSPGHIYGTPVIIDEL